MKVTITNLRYSSWGYTSNAVSGAAVPLVFERALISKKRLMNINLAFFMVLVGLVWLSSCQAAESDSESPGVVQKVEHAIQRGAKAAASGVQRGAKAAAHGVERAANATAHGVHTAASATAHGVEVAVNKVKGSDTPDTSANQ
jgi:hypothetical protein